MKDSELFKMRNGNIKFPVRSKLYIEKTGSFLAFGLS